MEPMEEIYQYDHQNDEMPGAVFRQSYFSLFNEQILSRGLHVVRRALKSHRWDFGRGRISRKA